MFFREFWDTYTFWGSILNRLIQVYSCIPLWRLQRTWNWAKRNIQKMMKEVTDKKYKLQIEEKLWSDQYPAAINCFGLLLEHFKESLWINLGSQILIDLWWNSCQTVKTPLNIQYLPNSKIMHQTTKNDIIYY